MLGFIYFLHCESLEDLQLLKRADLIAERSFSCFPYSIRTTVFLPNIKQDCLTVCLYSHKKHSAFITHEIMHFYPKELKFKSIKQTTKDFLIREYSLLTM
jgi:hypothetical protein